MTSKDIIARRLEAQGIVGAGFADAEAAVRWMGCMQAQDFAMAKWAVGLRASGLTEAQIDEDFNAGKVLRTHVLRPTWHFVLPVDIGWMLKLTGPRIKQFSKPMHRQLGIEEAVLRRSRKILVKALKGGAALTRQELVGLFRRAKINTDDIRMSFLLLDAELEGLVCSGPRKGKQFSYMLMEERVGMSAGTAQRPLALEGDAAIGELAGRYFRSRGPATLQDFSWWCGLTLGQARRGFELVKGELECAVVNGQAYWFSGEAVGKAVPPVLLLPAYDEYAVAYKDRSDLLTEEYAKASFNGLKPVVVVNGRVAGMWKRGLEKGKMVVEVKSFGGLSKGNRVSVERAARKFALFAGSKEAEVRL